MIVMPRRLSDEVASRVRALIEEQQLEAGMKLPAERQLAVQLGVSRNSLREALAKLVSEGVLISRRGGGTFVRWQHEAWSEQNIVQPLKPCWRTILITVSIFWKPATPSKPAPPGTQLCVPLLPTKRRSGSVSRPHKAKIQISPRRQTFAFISPLRRPHTTWCCYRPCAVSSTYCSLR